MSSRHLLGALAISLTACASAPAHQKVPPATALAQAEARWQARKPGSYEFEIYVQCFCPPLAQSRARVVNGVVQKVGGFSSVERLFEVIHHYMSRGEYRIAVEYDRELGYPVSADLDPRREVKDDELVFHVRGFRPLPTPGAGAEAAGLVRRIP